MFKKVGSHKDFASSYGPMKNLLKRSLFEALNRYGDCWRDGNSTEFGQCLVNVWSMFVRLVN